MRLLRQAGLHGHSIVCREESCNAKSRAENGTRHGSVVTGREIALRLSRGVAELRDEPPSLLAGPSREICPFPDSGRSVGHVRSPRSRQLQASFARTPRGNRRSLRFHRPRRHRVPPRGSWRPSLPDSPSCRFPSQRVPEQPDRQYARRRNRPSRRRSTVWPNGRCCGVVRGVDTCGWISHHVEIAR